MTMPGAGNRVCPRLLFPKIHHLLVLQRGRRNRSVHTQESIFNSKHLDFIFFKDGKDHYADINI